MRFALVAAVVTLVVLGAVLAAARAGVLRWERATRRPGRLATRVSEAVHVRLDRRSDEFVDAQAAVWDHTSVASGDEPDDEAAPPGAPAPRSERFGHRRRYSAARARISGWDERDDPGPRDDTQEPPHRQASVAVPDREPARDESTTKVPTFRPALVESLSEPDPEPEPATETVTSLARRTPKATPAANRSWSMSAERTARPVGRSRRSPDQVRANLASYRSGLRKGRDTAVGED